MRTLSLSVSVVVKGFVYAQGGANLRGLQSTTWDGTLATTHYWDCNGQDCDSKTVPAIETPAGAGNWVWQSQLFSASPLYAPLDPNDHGGPSEHGEKFWMTGAASDDLAALLGPDITSCGTSDLSPGGCGKCLLVQNSNAVNSDWKVMVMKKNRCPPESNGCEAGKLHLDLAVPGYDDVTYSTANICAGNPRGLSRDTTFGMTYESAASCSMWWDGHADTQSGCDCSSVTADYALQAGCKLFTEWGWKAAAAQQLSYKLVDCPTAFTSVISGAFSVAGPSHGTTAPAPTPGPVATTTPATTPAATTAPTAPPCQYEAQGNTAVKFNGTGGKKLKRKKYGSTAKYIAACQAACSADPGCGGFVDDTTDRRGRMCKPKKTGSVGYSKKKKTFYVKGSVCV